jgi:ParB-like chromosome segregation protein Spo0J
MSADDILPVHPVAELFPMLPDADLREMAASIARDGLIHPCITYRGALLDGRNRVAACRLAGVPPRLER